MTCKICSLETANHLERFHDACRNCIYCGNEVGESIIEKLLDDEDEESPSRPLIYHLQCRQNKLEQDFKNSPVTITQGHLDMLNAANLMFRANMDLSIETNQKQAELESYKFVHEMSIDEIFVTIKRMNAITAMWSIALDKKKTIIEARLAERELVNFKDLKNADERITIEKDRVKKREREALKLSPALRAREKAIEAMVKFAGMTREQAELNLGPKESVQ